VIFDVEGDGDLDIVTTEYNDYPQVLINDLNAKKKVNCVQIKLIGKRSNRGGLGARVTVTTAMGERGERGDRGDQGERGDRAKKAAPLPARCPASLTPSGRTANPATSARATCRSTSAG
jgi:hypothetical protein